MNVEQQLEFLDHMRAGMRRGAAAEVLGLRRRLVVEFIAANEEFEKDVIDAEAEATENVEEALYQSAVTGSVAAAKLWLELRKPKSAGLPVLYEEQTSNSGDPELDDIFKMTTD